MSTTYSAIVQEMLARVPQLGEILTPASATTTTVVVAEKAIGTAGTDMYAGQYIFRPDAATAADRVRLITQTGYTASTGTFTHAGPNYSDTTVTSETVILTPYNPRLFYNAINQALGSIRFMDESFLPASRSGRQWWNQLSWVEEPGQIDAVYYQPGTNILSRNRYFEKWNTYNSSGVLTPPDSWVLAGSGATVTRSTTQTWKTPYSAALTRSGTNCTLTQTVGVLETGVSGSGGESLRGEVVEIEAYVWASVASRLRLFLSDGSTTTNSSYHTGGSTWEKLSATATMSATATNVTFGFELNSGDTTGYLGEAYLVRNRANDSQRRDGPWSESQVWRKVPGQTPNLPVELPYRNVGGRYRILSQRPYPALLNSQLVNAGSGADAVVVDCPLDLATTCALAEFYAARAMARGQVDTSKDEAAAMRWGREAETARRGHLYKDGTGAQRGISIRKKPWASRAAMPMGRY